MMKKYTFIAEYKGGTYIDQYWAQNVFEAEYLWANNLDLDYFTNKEKKRILEKIDHEEFPPVLLNGAEGVWHDHLLVFKESLFLNIVETCSCDCPLLKAKAESKVEPGASDIDIPAID